MCHSATEKFIYGELKFDEAKGTAAPVPGRGTKFREFKCTVPCFCVPNEPVVCYPASTKLPYFESFS